MPRLETTQANREDTNWIAKWERILTSGMTAEDLAEQFEIRWQRNAPSFAPARLRPPSSFDQDADWSIWLERFLLSNCEQATVCATLLVRSIQIATERWDADLGRIVWFRDVAALRRVAYADDIVRHTAASMLLQTMHKLVGTSVDPELSNYMHLEKLYSVASSCLVSELYEPEPSNHLHRAGLAGGSFQDFTVVWQLERARLDFIAPRNPERNGGNSTGLAEHWVKLAQVYQSTADDLFETLLNLTSQVETGNNLLSRATIFKSFLQKSFSPKSKMINDYAKYLGYQRLLDIHWVRFSVLVSPQREGMASHVRRFVLFVSEGQLTIREKINRSTLVLGWKGPLTPKRDPRQAISLSDTHHGNLEVELSDVDQLAILALSNPELCELLEELES